MTGQHAGPRRERLRTYTVWAGHETPPEQPPAPETAPAETAPAPVPALAWPHPATLYDDLAACVLFRDTVRSVYIRTEARHCDRPHPAGPWQDQYAATWAHRTSIPPADTCDFGVSAAAEASLSLIAADHAEARRVVFGNRDTVDAEIDAGFYRARRWFHSEDTAGFPAVA